MPHLLKGRTPVHYDYSPTSIEEVISLAEARFGVGFTRLNNDEAYGPCTVCGSQHDPKSDRFRLFKEGNYWCRQCGSQGWVTDERELSTDDLHGARLRSIERRLGEVEDRLSAVERIAAMVDDVKRYYDSLTEEAVDWWHDTQGVSYNGIAAYQLGYCSSCPTEPGTPSYTIPYWQADGKLLNIRHRLATPKGGKYRPHIPGLGIAMFEDRILPLPKVLLVEGEVKTIVMTEHGFPSVGLMGCNSFKDVWAQKFKGGEVTVALDPGVEDRAWEIAETIARAGVATRVAELPGKPDDMLIKQGATTEDMKWFLKHARKV